tara:strand:+ start:965 stop:1252 length:288 start_codon:yes stop_codon:yes gene_type:complete
LAQFGTLQSVDLPHLMTYAKDTQSLDNFMITGTVKWFNETKGYGFIAVDGQDDVFVHISAAQAAGLRLTENMKVSFEKQQGNNGKYSAVNLEAAD